MTEMIVKNVEHRQILLRVVDNSNVVFLLEAVGHVVKWQR